MSTFEIFEYQTLVVVPGVGPMERIEILTMDGESLGVSYRWPQTISLADVTPELVAVGA